MKYNQKGGNSVLNIFLGIFVAIGIIAILYIAIVYIANSVKKAKLKEKQMEMSPSASYMKETGFDCPDYWIKMYDKNGRSYCKNSYNLKQNPVCKNNNEINFKNININSWQRAKDKMEVPGLKERCDWVKKCGGVWQGVDNYC